MIDFSLDAEMKIDGTQNSKKEVTVTFCNLYTSTMIKILLSQICQQQTWKLMLHHRFCKARFAPSDGVLWKDPCAFGKGCIPGKPQRGGASPCSQIQQPCLSLDDEMRSDAALGVPTKRSMIVVALLSERWFMLLGRFD
jgi:hypothetical protein